MAEAKNTFIKSKMNKDLDDRLIHNQEYRDAQNVAVSRSEDADVGALENVLGNISVTDFGYSVNDQIDIIGKYTDLDNDRVFVFLTNFIDTSADRLSVHTNDGSFSNVKCAIGVYNINSTTYNILVEGAFLNFSKTHIITGVNLLENLLFWTDNRNQPRKINITSALNDSTYYTLEHQISVAKYYPNTAAVLIKNETLTVGGDDYTDYFSTMRDMTSNLLPDNATNNPFGPSELGANWEGDADFLKEKFVRFSYRFKFEDNEYSLLAPFTQICFVPEQDGYFLAKKNQASGVPDQEDVDVAYKDTEVRFMRNKVNQITLMIPPPTNGVTSGLWSDADAVFKIKEIQIIYKEANGLALYLIDKISKEDFTSATTTALNLHRLPYIYNSQKPYKVLPNDEIVRVSDRVPLRAASQEVSGNRVIYGNYIDKGTPPKTLNYQTSVAVKGALQGDGTANPSAITSPIRKEYQNHTLKQNRSYDTAIVLSDLYGRQSVPIPTSQANGKASTIFHNYKQSSFSDGDSISAGNLYSATDTWPGDCLRMIFYDVIPSSIADEGYPGLWSESNPTGWYSYKVVVKQKEQEYYNIYFPGVLVGSTNPNNPSVAGTLPGQDNPISYMVLHSDNINKVPRDLKTVGPEQALFRSGNKPEKPNFQEYVLAQMGGNVQSAESLTNILTNYNQLVEEAEKRIKEREDELARFENASVELYPRVYNWTTNLNTRQAYPYVVGKNLIPEDIVTIGTGRDLDLINGSGTVSGIEIISGGGIYTSPVPSPQTLGGGSGTGLNVALTDVGGVVTSVSITNGGSGYKNGDIVQMTYPAQTAPFETATFKVTVAEPDPQFYDSKSNPLLGKIRTQNTEWGKTAVDGMGPTLAVYETKPVNSNIDLYWETSTSGDVSSLNTDILANTTEICTGWGGLTGGTTVTNYSTDIVPLNVTGSPSGFVEAQSVGYQVTGTNSGDFVAVNNTGGVKTALNCDMSIVEVLDGKGNDVTSRFTLTEHTAGPPSQFRINTNYNFLHWADNDLNKFTFYMKITEAASTIVSYKSIGPISLLNSPPTFVGLGTTFSLTTAGGVVTNVSATNGSANTSLNKKELTFDIASQALGTTPVSYFTLGPQTTEGTVQLMTTSTIPAGTYSVSLKVTDGGGSSITSSVITVKVT